MFTYRCASDAESSSSRETCQWPSIARNTVDYTSRNVEAGIMRLQRLGRGAHYATCDQQSANIHLSSGTNNSQRRRLYGWLDEWQRSGTIPFANCHTGSGNVSLVAHAVASQCPRCSTLPSIILDDPATQSSSPTPFQRYKSTSHIPLATTFYPLPRVPLRRMESVMRGGAELARIQSQARRFTRSSYQVC